MEGTLRQNRLIFDNKSIYTYYVLKRAAYGFTSFIQTYKYGHFVWLGSSWPVVYFSEELLDHDWLVLILLKEVYQRLTSVRLNIYSVHFVF